MKLNSTKKTIQSANVISMLSQKINSWKGESQKIWRMGLSIERRNNDFERKWQSFLFNWTKTFCFGSQKSLMQSLPKYTFVLAYVMIIKFKPSRRELIVLTVRMLMPSVGKTTKYSRASLTVWKAIGISVGQFSCIHIPVLFKKPCRYLNKWPRKV